MIYSVWDQGKGRYDYYEKRFDKEATNAPKPGHLKSAMLGLAPEQAAWPLPAGAQLIGSGKYPKGHIAEKKTLGALGMIPPMTLPNVLIMGALGFVAYKYLTKR